jgi:glycosyltransferase involved in cell wall biosynthesis
VYQVHQTRRWPGVKMKIAIVTGIFPPDIGGPATFVPLIAQQLSARHRIRGVLTLGDTVSGMRHDFPYPVISIRRSLPKLFRIPFTVWQIARLAKGSDVVLSAGLVLETILATTLLISRPTVVRVGGDKIWEGACAAKVTNSSIENFQTEKLPFKWRLLRAVQAIYTRMASVVITPSEQLAGVIRECWKVPGSSIHVVPNAVTAFSTEQEVEDPEWCDQFDVLTVCRLLPLKGLESLVEVAVREQWKLGIIGDGPLRQCLEERIRQARAGADIQILGRVSQAKVARALRGSKVFVLNSIGEGLPNSLLEAKANGLPVVATSVGGNKEIVRHGTDGFLIPSGDNVELAVRVNQLLSDPPTRATFGAAGKRDVADRFCIARMSLCMERALLDAVDKMERQQ